MNFDSQLIDAFSNLGLPLSEGHRFGANELEQAERRLGAVLPAVLRQYYLLAGRHPINVAHNELLSPDELGTEGEVLVFMQENQGVMLWGIRADGVSLADRARGFADFRGLESGEIALAERGGFYVEHSGQPLAFEGERRYFVPTFMGARTVTWATALTQAATEDS